MPFKNRYEAGNLLAQVLEPYRSVETIVYALPRGGVEVGAEIARYLDAPLDLLIPRKVGHPINPEFAVCAVTESGEPVCDPAAIFSLEEDWLEAAIMSERNEARRRRKLYMPHLHPVSAKDRVAIIADDGVATGLTALAAIQDARERGPSKIILATPVIPRETAELLVRYADELIALVAPRIFMGAVGAYYDEFEQVEDDEVLQLLQIGNLTLKQ